MSEEQHSENHTNYVKIWAILVALLVVCPAFVVLVERLCLIRIQQ